MVCLRTSEAITAACRSWISGPSAFATETEQSDVDAAGAALAEKTAEAETESAAACKQVAQARRAIPGLELRAEEAQAEVRRLEAMTPDVLLAFFRAEADRTTGEYVEYAFGAMELLRRLQILDSLAGKHAPSVRRGRGFLPLGINTAHLPVPTLPSGVPHADPNHPSEIALARKYVAGYSEAEAQELERIRRLGIQLG